MMLKITILLFVATFVFLWVGRVMINTMRGEEKMSYLLTKKAPVRVKLFASLHLLSLIAAIVCTVITVIKW